MRKELCILMLALAFAASSWGAVSFSVDVGSLKDGSGNPLVQKGMLYLISSPGDDAFSLPVEGAVIGAGSDDEIVAAWDLSSEVSIGGEYVVSALGVPFGASWAEGNQLALLWFPNLTVDNQNPGATEVYGFYRNSAGGLGGDSWEMPADGTLLHSLKFFTSDENPLVSSSDLPSQLGAALLAVGEDAGPPVAPTVVATNENTPGAVSFEWQGASVPGGVFRVERKIAGESEWTVMDYLASDATSYSDSSIGRGKNYEYRTIAINGFETVMSTAASIETLRSNVVNISTRGLLGSGDNVLILGWVLQGTGDSSMLATAIGPEMGNNQPFPLTPDPNLKLYQRVQTMVDGKPVFSQEIRGENQDWADTQQSEVEDMISRTYASPFSEISKDAAMAMTLPIAGAGVFTAIADDPSTEEGIARVELFDGFVGAPNDASVRVMNLSTRGYVGTDDYRLIGGMIVKGQVDTQVLIRGRGPSININGTLADPQISLYRRIKPGVVELVGSNDNWEDGGNATEIAEVSSRVGAGALEPGAKDSVILTRLEPGVGYTVVLEGVDRTTGIGLIEIFQAD